MEDSLLEKLSENILEKLDSKLKELKKELKEELKEVKTDTEELKKDTEDVVEETIEPIKAEKILRDIFRDKSCEQQSNFLDLKDKTIVYGNAEIPVQSGKLNGFRDLDKKFNEEELGRTDFGNLDTHLPRPDLTDEDFYDELGSLTGDFFSLEDPIPLDKQKDAELRSKLSQVFSEDYESIDKQEFHWEFNILHNSMSDFTLQTNPINREISDTFRGLKKALPQGSILAPLEGNERYFIWSLKPSIKIEPGEFNIDTHLDFNIKAIPSPKVFKLNTLSDDELQFILQGVKNHYLNSLNHDGGFSLIETVESFIRLKKDLESKDLLPDYYTSFLDYALTEDFFLAKTLISDGECLKSLKPSQVIYLYFKYSSYMSSLINESPYKKVKDIFDRLAKEELNVFNDVLSLLDSKRMNIAYPGDMEGFLNNKTSFRDFFTSDMLRQLILNNLSVYVTIENKDNFNYECAFLRGGIKYTLKFKVGEKDIQLYLDGNGLTFNKTALSVQEFESDLDRVNILVA